MDLNHLKLQLIQQIITIDDLALLERIRSILDKAESNIVAEGEAPYFKLEDRMYSAEEVRAMLEPAFQNAKDAHDPSLDQKEWSELDADHAAYLRGEGSNYSWEVKEQLHRDRDLSEGKLADLEASRDQYLRGEGQWHNLEELQARMNTRTVEFQNTVR